MSRYCHHLSFVFGGDDKIRDDIGSWSGLRAAVCNGIRIELSEANDFWQLSTCNNYSAHVH